LQIVHHISSFGPSEPERVDLRLVLRSEPDPCDSDPRLLQVPFCAEAEEAEPSG
jgi:hypothetical protein